jgi:hypothetical protein
MKGVTYRSIAIGLLLIPANVLWVVLAEFGWYSGFPTCLSLFFNAVFCVFPLVVANLALQRVRPRWALLPQEILVVYTMVCIASGLAGHDTLQLLIPTITHLDRYGAPDGLYADILPLVPSWLVVRDPVALQGAYAGQETIYNWANLGPWIRPLSWWGAFVIALCAVMGGLNLVLRKQWVEHEKLAYPILQIPMVLTTQPKALLTSRLFWAGFGIAAAIDIFNGLSFFYPLVPSVPIASIMNLRWFFTERPWSDIGDIIVSFYPFAIGMFFFMPLDLAFSCWFFFLLFKAERVLASHFGMQMGQGFPFIDEQMAGGFYAIAILALWMSRRQILQMVRTLLGRSTGAETAWERQEARLAPLLIVGGGAFLLFFSCRAGMSLAMAALFFALFFLISIAIVRMRVELGPPVHDLHSMGPNIQLVNLFGMTQMRDRNPANLVMFGMYNFFNRVYRGHPMPHGMEAYRIAHVLKMDNRRYTLAMAAAILAGTLFSFWALLWMFYKYGGAAEMVSGDWFGWEIWRRVDSWFTAPQPHRASPTVAIVAGLLFSLGLAALRLHLAWLPLHPVAFALSGTWSMDRLWACVFTAWALKTLILRYGGAKAYKPAVPFFMGLILGDFLVGAFWNLYGIVMEVVTYRFWF